MIFGQEITPSLIFMITGFLLSMYACVSNDVIQTLGTFLSSNRHRPRWAMWAFASAVLVITMTYGWIVNDGDMAFGRLGRIPFAETFYWWHVLPPIVLIFLTRFGMPVSTTFLVLSIFSSSVVISQMIVKSLLGYIVAFVASIVLYMLISKPIENHFLNSCRKEAKRDTLWNLAKWGSTAFLWSQWIMQDMANLFVYLPRKINLTELIVILIVFVIAMGTLMLRRGGKIQKVVKLKINTKDIRSATIIDCIYAFILFYFKQLNNIPMSTTWVFIGLLAGRELAIYHRIRHKSQKKVWKHIGKDFAKITVGLAVSVVVVEVILNINTLQHSLVTFFANAF